MCPGTCVCTVAFLSEDGLAAGTETSVWLDWGVTGLVGVDELWRRG